MDESVNSEWFISLQLSPKFLYEKRHVVLFISRDHRRDDLKEKFKRFGQQDENRYTIVRKGLGQLVSLPVIAGASEDLRYQFYLRLKHCGPGLYDLDFSDSDVFN